MANQMKDYDLAVKMYADGMSVQQVADAYGKTRQAMWKVLKRRGVEMRSNLRFGENNHFYRNGGNDRDRVAQITASAIEKGQIVPQPCEICGEDGLFNDGRRKVHAHHDDYNQPLKVRWLCYPHHFEWHKDNKPIPLESDFPKMTPQQIASLGGKISTAKLTHEERCIRARKAWEKRRLAQ